MELFPSLRAIFDWTRVGGECVIRTKSNLARQRRTLRADGTIRFFFNSLKFYQDSILNFPSENARKCHNKFNAKQ